MSRVFGHLPLWPKHDLFFQHADRHCVQAHCSLWSMDVATKVAASIRRIQRPGEGQHSS
jgi:hypothetical protein